MGLEEEFKRAAKIEALARHLRNEGVKNSRLEAEKIIRMLEKKIEGSSIRDEYPREEYSIDEK
jgi:hypothetical protein